jgi:hypothetical protein
MKIKCTICFTAEIYSKHGNERYDTIHSSLRVQDCIDLLEQAKTNKMKFTSDGSNSEIVMEKEMIE